MPVPVTLVVPLWEEKRWDFFHEFALPSYQANDPESIIVVGDHGHVTEWRRHTAGEWAGQWRGTGWNVKDLPSVIGKRNLGASYASTKYVMHSDDDTVMAKNTLGKMAGVMANDPSIDFVYCNYLGICPNFSVFCHQTGPVFTHRGRPYDPALLMKGNYISTQTLLRRETTKDVKFCEDPEIAPLSDWDFFLQLARLGRKGYWLDETLLHLYFLDRGLSANVQPAFQVMMKKYGIKRIGFG